MGFLLPLECAVLVTEYAPIFSCLNPEIVTECAVLAHFYSAQALNHGWVGLINIDILISKHF